MPRTISKNTGSTVTDVRFRFAPDAAIARGFLGEIRFLLHLGDDEYRIDSATLHVRRDGALAISWARRPRKPGRPGRPYFKPGGRTRDRIEGEILAALFAQMDEIRARAARAGVRVREADGAILPAAPITNFTKETPP